MLATPVRATPARRARRALHWQEPHGYSLATNPAIPLPYRYSPFVAVCRVATMHDPICPDRGYLNALAGTPSSDSCGHCICPDGWGGVDCSGVRVQRAWKVGGM